MSYVLSELDEKQKLCLRLVHQGYTSKQIAQQTHLSSGTVDQYIFRANATLGVADRRAAARLLAEAEQETQLKRSQLKSTGLAASSACGLIDEQDENLPDRTPADNREHPRRPTSEANDPGRVATMLNRALSAVGGKPHELDFRQKLMATSWVALATGGTLSALVAAVYWLNHLIS